jgi:hypothetical protein
MRTWHVGNRAARADEDVGTVFIQGRPRTNQGTKGGHAKDKEGLEGSELSAPQASLGNLLSLVNAERRA